MPYWWCIVGLFASVVGQCSREWMCCVSCMLAFLLFCAVHGPTLQPFHGYADFLPILLCHFWPCLVDSLASVVGTTSVEPLLPLSCWVECRISRHLGELSWTSWSCHLPGHLYRQCPAGGYVVLGGTLGVAVSMVCCCFWWGVGSLGVPGTCCQYCAVVLNKPVHRWVRHSLSAMHFPLDIVAFAVLP